MDDSKQLNGRAVAIVGMACRMPGNGDGLDGYWSTLLSGQSAVGPVARRQWTGSSSGRFAGLLPQVDQFDPEFFGISPREAVMLDPQQRLLLEVSADALSSAGIPLASLRETRMGIFVGSGMLDYQDLIRRSKLDAQRNVYSVTGNGSAFGAGRLAYFFGTEGPCLSVETTCSSSLVAVHLAVESLRSGRCQVALAGGVNLILSERVMDEIVLLRALSPTGMCRPFEAKADGFVRGEGCGVLVLKPLADALRDYDDIFAVIAGSAINHDGRSNGLTAPNVAAQERLLRGALADADVEPSAVGLIEAHGTGTPLGDPIEFQALRAVLGAPREDGSSCLLGSVKADIGHLEAAAGVAGLIKAVLALRHELVPKQTHFETLNPRMSFADTPFVVPTQATAWPRTDKPRFAGISSFGMSGTNAHVLLREAPARAPCAEPQAAEFRLLPVSARTRDALTAQLTRHAQYIETTRVDLAALTQTAALGRDHYHHRAAAVGRSADELVQSLRKQADLRTPQATVAEQKQRLGAGVCFLFTGQGSQYPGMGRELRAEPAFRRALTLCDEIADSEGISGGLSDALTREPELVNQTAFTQPALFALEYALSELWRAWGVVPSVVLGHSVGEYVAATLAGVMQVEDALRMVIARGRLMQALPSGGAMLAVRARESVLLEALRGLEEQVSIAAYNAPEQLVASGNVLAVNTLRERLTSMKVKTQPLTVSHAFHSPLMRPMLEEFEQVVRRFTLRPPRCPLISNLSGKLAGDELTHPSYWAQHILEGVRFEQGVRAVIERGVCAFLEIGPQPVLTGLASSFADDPKLTWIPSLRRGEPDRGTLLRAAAQLYAVGHDLRWQELQGAASHKVQLPSYPYARQRVWLEAGEEAAALNGMQVESAGLVPTGHPLLGASVTLADSGRSLLTGRLGLQTQPWLADHVVRGLSLLPGAALLELALTAARHVDLDAVLELDLEQPLVIPPTGALLLQVGVSEPDADGQSSFSISARVDTAEASSWTRHARGVLGRLSPETTPDLRSWPPHGASALDVTGLYERVEQHGLAYGPAFRGLRACYQRGDVLYAEVALPEGTSAGQFALHPALLDAALHTLLVHAPQGLELPFSFSGVSLQTRGKSALRVALTPVGGHGGFALSLADARSGEPVGSVRAVRTRAASGELGPRLDDLYQVNWFAAPTSDEGAPLSWASLGSEGLLCAPRHVPDLASLLAADQPIPATILACFASAESEPSALGAQAREVASSALALLNTFVSEPRLAHARLVVVTRRAIATTPGEDVLDLASSTLWGLVRAAQAEHPGRLTLLDLDAADLPEPLLLRALGSDEPELSVRGTVLSVPRLVRAEPSAATFSLTPGGTVLITGGNGMLGGVLARHLVLKHGVKHLLIAARSGRAGNLVQELRELGAQAEVRACDVADREAVRALLSGIPAQHPLCAVFHAAGTIDDGVLGALDATRIERVFAPKVSGALHLDELTQTLALDAFVVFSSLAGVIGSPGQANYAAANTFLDALVHRRRARGQVGQALAWGYWEERGSISEQMSESGTARLRAAGILPIPSTLGTALFDLAVGSERALLVPARFDLQALGRAQYIRPLFTRLVRPAAKPVNVGSRERLGQLAPKERAQVVLELVQTSAATVLGIPASGIDPLRPLQELGLDSLMAVEVRNLLAPATGLRLSATLLFDYPTLRALAQYIDSELASKSDPVQPAQQGQRDDDDPVAIVAMSCRYPGGVTSPAELWNLLASGSEAITEFPDTRGWDTDRLYDPNPDAVGKTYTRRGGFLHDADQFDPDFFGISRREAVAIDPQQRLLLELSWELFEGAGIAPEALFGTATGVYVGVMYSDYGARPSLASAEVEGYLGTGSAPSVASGRIAYTFGLQGPALTIDTACSSSLVGLHLACEALRRGECTLALAGGVTIMATPSSFVQFSRQRGLAADGRCKPFSARSDGTAWAEGAGLLLLERLSDARRNGHRVLALVRGSAVNQDGKSQGLTAPNGPAQEQVIRKALHQAGLDASGVDAVEAHGTGTTLGDPIEARALLATYARDRTPERPVWLGSLKSNLGHTQAAAGVGGVIKMVLAMQHATLPKTLFAEEPSPHVDWSSGTLRLLSDSQPWPSHATPRRAAVSSFGISGTNAHVILEECAEERPEAPAIEREQVILLPLSAKTENGLRRLADSYAKYLEGDGVGLDIADLAYTAGAHRTHHAHRLSVAARTKGELGRALRAAAQGDYGQSELAHGQAFSGQREKCVFVFSGQGSQWHGMGRRLFAEEPVFRDAIAACDERLRAHGASSPLDFFAGRSEPQRLDDTDVQQPLLFAIQVALVALLRSWGVVPDAVLGHSVGEIAAAHAVGAVSLDSAARIVALRAQAMHAAGTGKMLWVAVSRDEATALVAGAGDALAIAAVNDPGSVVFAGAVAAIDELFHTLKERQVPCRLLPVTRAFHSPHMDAAAAALQAALGELESSTPSVPFYSSVSQGLLGDTALNAAYWASNLREPVQFAGATLRALDDGYTSFLELGASSVLATSLRSCVALRGTHARVIPTLRRDADDALALRAAVGSLYTLGCSLAWPALFQGQPAIVQLPAYPWQRERFWLDAAPPMVPGSRPAAHALLGARFSPAAAPGQHYWEAELDLQAIPYLADHTVQGRVVFPCAAYLEMALAAGHEVLRCEALVLEDFVFERLLDLSDGPVSLQLSLLLDAQGVGRIEIASRSDGTQEWLRRAHGAVRAGAAHERAPAEQLERTLTDCQRVAGSDHYASLHALGLEYGPAFRGVEELLVEPGAAQGSVQLPSSAGDAAAYRAHPALLDACLQVAAAALGQEAGGDTLVPVAIAHLALHTRLPKRVAVSAVRGSSTGAQGVSLDLAVSCESGALLTVTGLRVQRLAAKPVEDALGRDAYVVRWIEQARRDGARPLPSRSDVWLVFADAQGVGAAVAGELREQARRCCVVQSGAHFACLAPDRYVISPSEPEHYERLLSELLATSTLRGIVHAFSLDAAAPESITRDSLIADTERGSLSVVMLTQALARRGFRDPPRLVLLTRGAQAACARGLSSPSQSALWGLTRTLTMEVAELGFVRIDLDPTPERSEVRAVVQELLSDDEEDQVALRAGSRLVARLSQSPLPPALPATFHQDACYLITGGLGGLGLSVASFMVSQGARHIVLLSRRSALGANERAALAELEANGATVRFMTADVAKPQDIEGVLEELARGGPPLRGVLHLAASLDDRTVLSMDEAAFWTPFAPKVLGAWNLHVATLGLPLDFFVLYSSAAALLGSPGQSNYAAANAFLDALAQLRKTLGLPAVSIQWGPFSEVGLAAATAARGERLGLHGIRSMTPDDGNTLLGRLIAQPMAEVGLVHLTFRELVQLYPRLGSAPFYAGLDRGPAHGRGPALLRAELAQTPAEQRYALLEQHVLTLLAKTLRRTPESVDVRAPLQTLGLDSLMSLELKSALETALDLTLSSTLLYTYTSVDALVPYLLSQLAFASAAAEPLPAQNEDLDGLDADGLMAALDQQLAAIRTRRN